MKSFVMLIGLPSSGKSTHAKALADNRKGVIVSSDEYRERLYGSESLQGDSNKLFETIQNDIVDYLQRGFSHDLIFDATNVSRKYRKPLLDRISKMPNIRKECILVATQYKKCIERNAKRDRVVPEAVIKRMRENFNVPTYQEGFDEISIVYDYDEQDYKVNDLLSKMDSFEQNNPHHSFTLGAHSRQVCQYLFENVDIELLSYAGLFHDVGKLETGVYKDMKENSTEICHYYFHENVGCYESLFYLEEYGFNKEEVLKIATLILYHMRLYSTQTEKSKKKLLDTVGQEIYDWLWLLNRADKLAH